MKKYFLIILIMGVLGSACTSRATQISTVPSKTISPTLTSTAFFLPTLTQTVPTPTFTVIPIIPTITVTFDVSKIITVTPAEKAICPTTQPAENINFDFLDMSFEKPENRDNVVSNTLKFLNRYGPLPLITYLRDNENQNYFSYIDLTDDDIPELFIGFVASYIFGCQNGRYEKLLEIPPDGYLQPSRIFTIKDNNRNGIPEMTLLTGVWSQGGHVFQIYEWNGEKFKNLVLSEYKDYPDLGEIWVEATGKIHYEDIDHDLLNELILDSGIPVWETYVSELPWRNKTTYYEWNGENYIPTYFAFAIPEFRFQAVQDGDLAFSQSEFDKALSLYQDAIFSDKLKDYSPEIRKNLQDNWMSQVGGTRPTPTSYPSDLTEYPRLAAYSYYRIVLLHLLRGNASDAMTVFNTLQEKFPKGDPGYPYVEMAKVFMNEYQDTHNIAVACSVVIQYATKNTEILIPLGSNYHGSQSHIYEPEDVCPFK